MNDSRRGRAAYREEFLREQEFTVVVDREDRSEVKVWKLSDPLWTAPAQDVSLEFATHQMNDP